MTEQASSPGKAQLGYPGQPACRYCQSPLDRLRGGIGWCGGAACRSVRQAETITTIESQRKEAHQARLVSAITRHGGDLQAGARILGDNLEDIPIGVVSRVSRRTSVTPPERRYAFLSHLEKIVSESFSGDQLTRIEAADVRDDQPDSDAMNAACIVCQGRCCLHGADTHAFLDASVIDALRRRDPALTQNDVTAYYQQALPERSIERSCVFHGENGCTLERQWRSGLCNHFECTGKSRLRKHVTGTKTESVLWIGVERETDGSTLAAFDPKGGFKIVQAEQAAGDTDPVTVAKAVQSALAGARRRDNE